MKVIKRISTNGKYNLKSLTAEMESLVYINVRENYPDNWEKDFIIQSLCKGLKNLFHEKAIHLPGNRIKTSWQLFNLPNDFENVICDIGLIINISYHDGQSNQGVALLEVAPRDSEKNTFSIIRRDRIKKLHSNAHHSQLILCDYDYISGMAFPSVAESIIVNQPYSWNSWLPYTFAAAVPAGLAVSLGNKNTGLYKVSIPLSYQVCYRYLFGMDLDHRKNPLEICTGMKTEKGIPKYLVHLAISHSSNEPNKQLEYNTDLYKKLT